MGEKRYALSDIDFRQDINQPLRYKIVPRWQKKSLALILLCFHTLTIVLLHKMQQKGKHEDLKDPCGPQGIFSNIMQLEIEAMVYTRKEKCKKA